MSETAGERQRSGLVKKPVSTGLESIWQWLVPAAAMAMLWANTGAAQAQQAAATTTGASGLPLPRYVSLKAEPVNMRKGPGLDYPTAWILRRAGMPLEIVREYEAWREVRDADGSTGWVLGTLLSGRRTAMLQPWGRSKEPGQSALVNIYVSAREDTELVARVEAGATVDIANCDGVWCRIRLEFIDGYVEQKKLWGVYLNETIK